MIKKDLITTIVIILVLLLFISGVTCISYFIAMLIAPELAKAVSIMVFVALLVLVRSGYDKNA